MKQHLKTFLQACITINDQEFEQIAQAFKPRSIKRNHVLLPSGCVCNEFYYIVKGGLRVFYVTQKGHEKTSLIALDNTITTAMPSFLTRQASFEMIDALDDSELLVINHADFYHLVNTCRAWELFYRVMLERAYLHKTKRIELRVSLSAKQRFDALMLEHPQYLQRVSNRILASYLDITQETLSRLKSK